VARLGGAAALAFLVPAAWLAMRGVTAGEFLRQAVLGAAELGRPRMLGDLAVLAAPELAAPHRYLVPMLAWCVPALAVLGLLTCARGVRRGDGAAPALLGGLSLVVLLLSNQVFRTDPLIRILQCGPLAFLLLFALLARVRVAVRRPLLALPVALAAYVLAFSGNRTMPVEYTGTIAVRGRDLAPLDVHGRRFFVSRAQMAHLRDLVRFLSERTLPGEPIFVPGKPAIAYFLADRPNPTRRIRFGRGHVDELDAAFWERLREAGCRTVVLSDGWTPEEVFRTLPEGARPALARRIGGWTVWRWS